MINTLLTDSIILRDKSGAHPLILKGWKALVDLGRGRRPDPRTLIRGVCDSSDCSTSLLYIQVHIATRKSKRRKEEKDNANKCYAS